MTNYSGIYISGKLPIKEVASLELIEDILKIESLNHKFYLTLNGLEITLGGSGHRIVYIKHPKHPKLLIHTTDKKILVALEKCGLISAKETLRLYRKYRSFFWSSCFIISLAIFMALYFLFIDRDSFINILTNKIPFSVEQAYGEQIFFTSINQDQIIKNKKANNMLAEMAKPLLNQLNQTFPYKIKLYLRRDKSNNAFAMPGGFVVINQGLILEATDTDEVLGVIAHELGHVIGRHSLAQSLNQIGTGVLIAAFFGDFEGASYQLIHDAVALTRLNYSRDHELQADAFAVKILTAVQLNPNGLINFLTNLETHNSLSQLTNYFSTHPRSIDRVNQLKLLINQEQSKTVNQLHHKSSFDIKELQHILEEFPS